VELTIDWVHSARSGKGKGWSWLETRMRFSCRAGFGSRGIEGKILAANMRARQIPFLGLCLGMQLMCVEFARHVLCHEDANSTEFDRSTDAPGD